MSNLDPYIPRSVLNHFARNVGRYQILGLCVAALFFAGGSIRLLYYKQGTDEARVVADDADHETLIHPTEEFSSDDFLSQLVASHGGQLFPRQILTVRRAGEVVFAADGATGEELVVPVVSFARHPHAFRYDFGVENEQSSFGHTGSRSWSQAALPGDPGNETLPVETITRLLFSSDLGIPAVFVVREREHLAVVGASRVDGHPCIVVRYNGPRYRPQTLYVDAELGWVLKRSLRIYESGVGERLLEIMYDDFGLVESVLTPARETVFLDGKLQMIFRMERTEMNPPLDPQAFQPNGSEVTLWR